MTDLLTGEQIMRLPQLNDVRVWAPSEDPSLQLISGPAEHKNLYRSAPAPGKGFYARIIGWGAILPVYYFLVELGPTLGVKVDHIERWFAAVGGTHTFFQKSAGCDAQYMDRVYFDPINLDGFLGPRPRAERPHICPMRGCGARALVLFQTIECSNRECSKYVP